MLCRLFHQLNNMDVDVWKLKKCITIVLISKLEKIIIMLQR